MQASSTSAFALTTALIALLVAPSLAFASGISSSGGAAGSYETDPLLVTEKIKCVVIQVDDDGSVVVEDKRGTHRIPYDEKLKVTAQDRKQFDGRKRLTMDDLAVGQRLKVTVRPAAEEFVSIQVLKKRAAAAEKG